MATETKVAQNGKNTLTLPQLKQEKIVLKVKGITPLIVNRFSEKAKQMMLDKQMKKAKVGKEAKNPKEQYLGSIYYFEDKKKTGFPAVGFKAAMVRAGVQLGYKMTQLRGMFHVMADQGDLIEIKGKHRMREDMVRLATGVADIRFRAEYPVWSASVNILYNANSISAEELAQLLNMAGFACGLGEWRPEKNNSGMFGLFELVTG